MVAKVAGEAALTGNAGTTGNHSDHNGIGSSSISIRKSDGTWLDLLEIWFQDMEQSRFDELQLDYETTPKGTEFIFTEKGKAYCDAKRRLSKIQALWLTDQLSAFIQSLGHIPSDEDIKALDKRSYYNAKD